MKQTKYEQAKGFYHSGNLKECLKILKTFKYAFDKNEIAIITRSYEMMTRNFMSVLDLS